MSKLFTPLTMRGVTLRNRIVASPTCQYSAVDGYANSWHEVTYGARAQGGAGMVMVESTAVRPEGRIAPSCLGLWNEGQQFALVRVVQAIRRGGAVPAIQLSHSGRKGSTDVPWKARRFLTPDEGGWQVESVTDIPFSPKNGIPHVLSALEEELLIKDFCDAADRAVEAGFEVIEVHCAHGYLLNSYLSPLTNPGKSFDERVIMPLRVIEAVREVVPEELPVVVRISVTDWHPDGWTPNDSILFSKRLKALGIDLVDCSSGGILPDSQTNMVEMPGYLVPFAAAIRQVGIKAGAVGMITNPEQAERIIAHGQADLIFMARELMRNPHWPLTAARELGADFEWPNQLKRADL